jgi:AraC-like DNA-binding protein
MSGAKTGHLKLLKVRLADKSHWTHPPSGLQFVFPTLGSAACITARSSITLCPGDLLVKDGGTDTIIVSDTKNFAFSMFSLSVQHLMPLLTTGEVSSLAHVLERLKAPRIFLATAPLATKCHQLLSTLSSAALESRSQLVRIAALVLENEFQTLRAQPRTSKPKDLRLLQRLDRLSTDEIIESSVEELAQRIGCSRRHLNRLFHQHFKASMANLKMELRLRKAAALLSNRIVRVIDIADQCGFNHLGLFNSYFRKRFGYSPTQWRKRPADSESLQETELAKIFSGSLKPPGKRRTLLTQGFAFEI